MLENRREIGAGRFEQIRGEFGSIKANAYEYLYDPSFVRGHTSQMICTYSERKIEDQVRCKPLSTYAL